MTIPHELAEQALKLPLEDRRTLAHMLEASLPQTEVTLSKEWLDEIDRRTDLLEAGQSKLVPIEEIRRKAESLVAQHRTQ